MGCNELNYLYGYCLLVQILTFDRNKQPEAANTHHVTPAERSAKTRYVQRN